MIALILSLEITPLEFSRNFMLQEKVTLRYVFQMRKYLNLAYVVAELMDFW
jgi:hypothetical protein